MEGANFEQIAKRAGVAEVTIYRRWSSKEELLTQAIEQARTVVPEEEIWAAARTPVRQPDDRLVDSWVRTFGDVRFRAVLAQLIGSSTSHPALLGTYREQYIEPRRRLIRAVLERARQDGQLAEDADLDAVIDMVVGAAMYRMLIDAAAARDPAATRRYLDSILRQADRPLQPRSEEQSSEEQSSEEQGGEDQSSEDQSSEDQSSEDQGGADQDGAEQGGEEQT